jgi:hypothetical protein
MEDIADLSTDESAPDEAGYVKGIDGNVNANEQFEQSPTHAGAVKGDLNSLLQALVELKINETETMAGYVKSINTNVEQLEQRPTHTGPVKKDLNSSLQAQTTSRPELPPGFEDFKPLAPQPLVHAPGFKDHEALLPSRWVEMTVVVDGPQQLQQPTLKNKSKKTMKAKKTARADPVDDSKSGMQPESLVFHKTMASQQAIYYQRAMQWQAMQVEQMRAYAGELARYQQIAAAAQANRMQRVPTMQK